MTDSAYDAITILSIMEKHDRVKKSLINAFGADEEWKWKSKISKEVYNYIDTLMKIGAKLEPKNINIHIGELNKANAINDILEKDEKFSGKIIKEYGEMSIEDVFNFKESEVLKTANKFSSTHFQEPRRMGEGLEEKLMNREVNESGFLGYPTPWEQINTFTCGLLRPGSMTVINALPKVGKTIVLTNIAKYLAVDCKQPIYFAYNEMNDEGVENRVTSSLTGLPANYIELGLYNAPGKEKEQEKVRKASRILADSPLYVEQIRDYTAEKLAKRARYYKKRYGIVGMIFDYIKEPSDFMNGDKQLRFFLNNVVTVMKEQIADKLQIFCLSASQAKAYEIYKAGESHGIEKYCTAFLVLKELDRKEQNRHPMAKYGLVVKYNRYGNKHVDFENKFIPLQLDKTRLEFKEVN